MKGLKTGGRQKGTPNKATSEIKHLLIHKGVDLVEEALRLYGSSEDPEFKLKIISLLFPYRYPRVPEIQPDETIDVTKWDEMPTDEMKRLFISAKEGILELEAKIKERESGQT